MSLNGASSITTARDELKFAVTPAVLPALIGLLDRELSPHNYGSSPLAALSRHYTTTIYFDTPSLSLLKAAVGGDAHVKLRAREYYDVLPLDELATAQDELVRSAPILWLELKRRAGRASGKRRVGVPKRRLSSFLHTPAVDPELRAIQQHSLGPAGDEVLMEMLQFLHEVGEPMEASCIVNYARASWQDPAGNLRVTVDEELAVYRPNWGVIRRDVTLTRAQLGRACFTQPDAVVEIKTLGDPPPYLLQALSQRGVVENGQSKFVIASHAVHGVTPPDSSTG